MDKTQAFQVILQMREKFVGTKQEQILVDQALQILDLELFPAPKPEKEVKEVKSVNQTGGITAKTVNTTSN